MQFPRWLFAIRRIGLLLALLVAVMGGRLNASTILFTDTSLGAGLFRIDYTVSGITFQSNEELDIYFDASLYSHLQNAIVGTGFMPMVFQPNSPEGAPGIYGFLALSGPLIPTGTFSVDATVIGQIVPGIQSYEVDQYSASGMFLQTGETGFTSAPNGVPEPGSLPLNILLILIGGVAQAVRRRT